MNRPSHTRVAALVTGVSAGILALTVVLIALKQSRRAGGGSRRPLPSASRRPPSRRPWIR
jgi:hypothetical protein